MKSGRRALAACVLMAVSTAACDAGESSATDPPEDA